MTTVITVNGVEYRAPGVKTAVVCLDGCDPEYLDDALERRIVPRLTEMVCGGSMTTAFSQLPSFTNPNNLSIVTGSAPEVHGIPGNHFRSSSGEDVQLTDPSFLRAPSIHAEFHAAGISVLAVTTKDKLRGLLAAGGVPCVSVERAMALPIAGWAAAADAVGYPPPDIYDWDASHYALELGLALSERLEPQLLYVSLTDAVQHAAAPGSALSDRYLMRLDLLIGRYLDAGWRLGLVADHGMNAKVNHDGAPNVRYLSDELSARGVASAHVVLPITDRYVVHHAALGSACWVHVDATEIDAAAGALEALEGIEEVIRGDDAAAQLRLPRDRIGDLVVFADRSTVLGKSRTEHDISRLRGALRSHGGRHEQRIPLVLSEAPTKNVASALSAGVTNADTHRLLIGATA